MSANAQMTARGDAMYYVHSFLCLLIMFGFGQLPPVEPLTALGMRLIGIFLGLLYGWIFIDIVWPSMAGLLALMLVGGMKPVALLNRSFGGFSMLVGGFGIANIMFVSVRERTNQIGIQKALGAKNSFILLQFVFEAVFLSLIGGLIGILMVWGAMAAAEALSGMAFYLSLTNINIGVVISAVIGLLAGIMPAYTGARMDPVEAIRSGQ